MDIHGKTAFMAALFIASIFMIGIKMITPTPINIFMEGSDVIASQIPGFYTRADMFITAFFACLLGISTMYLLFFDSKAALSKNLEHILTDNVHLAKLPQVESPDESVTAKYNTEDILKVMKGNDRKVIELLVEFGELNQAELASRADIPKSTLSRTLLDLERRGVIIRYENGMSKMVKLADALQK
ncbi:MAG: winged helix-turn-helix transcriptional regulator [Candidatus Methanoperedens sp.]|uniref:winged helix-turn-helix transcriptional regulator n=1 Tax=Candidatus Methanoperedens sp. BLZ2 TaxID=2035255 RepID=UPI0015964E74|nr:winged helix-turn-helix transcriptional regulator [Candidatus Methanoperedens sp. BLZ2]MBZ0174671.1 winged helix-turn-helix transcriptional regulator [Candidatus Methanoperedens nitroreducens]MCX9078367.1 winged helix-turn-helix transcriptional regulator [Candidatus Methanoperedens sp.]